MKTCINETYGDKRRYKEKMLRKANQTFSEFDADGDGLISYDEFENHNVSFRRMGKLLVLPNHIEGRNQRLWKSLKKSIKRLKNLLKDGARDVERYDRKVKKYQEKVDKYVSRNDTEKADKYREKVEEYKQKLAEAQSELQDATDKLDSSDRDYKKLSKAAKRIAKRL